MNNIGNYQDYVIKDGELVGKFEEMYRDCPDHWNLSRVGRHKPVDDLALNAARRIFEEQRARKALDCGSSPPTWRRSATKVTGVDSSATAMA